MTHKYKLLAMEETTHENFYSIYNKWKSHFHTSMLSRSKGKTYYLNEILWIENSYLQEKVVLWSKSTK